MSLEITIPSPGESITEVTLGTWLKQDGDWVEQMFVASTHVWGWRSYMTFYSQAVLAEIVL